MLNSVSAGMQFPPDIQSDDMLNIYNQRIVKIESFTHSKSSSIGNEDLTIESFTGVNYGDDIGFAFNLPLFEKSSNCYDCNINPDELREVQIDGSDYKVATQASENFIKVQPDSGYLYQMKKDATVFMIIGDSQKFIAYEDKVSPFPSLDPIYGKPFPLYDFSENLQANEADFYNNFSYIATTHKQQQANIIADSVLCAFWLILGIVAITVYKFKDPKRRLDSEEETLVRNEELID